jgi:putative transposase
MTARPPVINQALATRVAELIQLHPTFGYRRLWAWLRFRDEQRVTRRTVYRLCERQGLFVHQRPATPAHESTAAGARPRAATNGGPLT